MNTGCVHVTTSSLKTARSPTVELLNLRTVSVAFWEICRDEQRQYAELIPSRWLGRKCNELLEGRSRWTSGTIMCRLSECMCFSDADWSQHQDLLHRSISPNREMHPRCSERTCEKIGQNVHSCSQRQISWRSWWRIVSAREEKMEREWKEKKKRGDNCESEL